jgi:4-hydroxybenzoate polyprenyltransferase
VRPARLARFVAQRFPPLSYGPLIVALVVCGRTAAALASDTRPGLDWQAVATTFVVAAAFLQLRILDEIRDAAIDVVGHPERPLPSGLVTESELRTFAVALALVAIALTVPFGPAELAACSLALITIWALGRDLPRWLALKHGMLGEALLHSVIVPELLLVARTSVAGLDAWACWAPRSCSRGVARPSNWHGRPSGRARSVRAC